MKKSMRFIVLFVMLMISVTACSNNSEDTIQDEKITSTTITEQKKDTEVVNNTEGLNNTEILDNTETLNNEEVTSNEISNKTKDECLDPSLKTIDVTMADEVGSNVHISWPSVSIDSGDGIQVCRGESNNGEYKVIATITEESYDYYKNGYIDIGALGKGYYYGVRIMKKDQYGLIGKVMQAVPTKAEWYKNADSYLQLIEQPDDVDYLIQFIQYDLSGNTTWNCDWPCMKNEEVFTWQVEDKEYTRTFQYRFSTPMEYDQLDAEPFVYYANVDKGEFILTMYHYDNECYQPVFDDTIFLSYD